MIFSNLNICIHLILAITSFSILISSIEYIWNQSFITESGFLDWGTLRLRHRILTKSGFVSKFFDKLFLNGSFLWINIARAILSFSIICMSFTSERALYYSFLVQTLALLTMLVSIRMPYGQDGADQMALITVSAYSLCSLIPAFNMEYFIFFIAIQGIMSYFFAGLIKIISSKWRSGQAILDIFSLEIYGSKAIYRILCKKKHLYIGLAWFTFGFECSSILLPFIPIKLMILFVGSYVFFHAFNAAFMNLNTFFWSFLAVQPAIIYFCNKIHLLH
ncbi:MAG: hypothetical protein S4CHLAM6_10220 [Chlamydiae bacterium]|nr:hypothetical protein [Chlamydiota bacterium]